MPKCKNDPKKSYKGTEPSPKGLGYCTHAEKVGTKRKVKMVMNGLLKKSVLVQKDEKRKRRTIKFFYKKSLEV